MSIPKDTTHASDVPNFAITENDDEDINVAHFDDTNKESDEPYLAITNEILDGIFAAEDCRKVTIEDKDDDDSSDCDCDWKICTVDESDFRIASQVDSPWQALLQPVMKGDREHYSIIHHIFQFCLSFATPTHSALFIIILSIIIISYSIWEGEF